MIAVKEIGIRQLLKWSGHHFIWLTCFMSGVALLYRFNILDFKIPWLPVSVIGTAVAFYVGFKNNQAYDRMWEARKVWGGIINDSRTWGMMVDSYIGATATGGRNGHVKSENGILDLEVRLPKALGGANDDFTNPEMLFAAGYSACFDSALNLVIQKTRTTSTTAKVGIGAIENGGFGLEVELAVNVPGVTIEEAQALVEKAHQVCPYSNATRGNIEVSLTVTNN